MKKTKTLIGLVVVLLMILCSGAWADQRTFPKGSMIIPMGGAHQPEADHGIFEAYGLVYALLGHKDAGGSPDPIPVFWIISSTKTSLAGTDFSISTDSGQDPALEYNHAGGTGAITSGIYVNAAGARQIDYMGGPYVIDAQYADVAKPIIDKWTRVNVHIANAPFTADIGRYLDGIPPKIALLNDGESHVNGNAPKILAAYLDIAGIPRSVFDVVTPNEVGGFATTVDGVFVPANPNGILKGAGGKYQYNLLWAPHWTAYQKHGADAKVIIGKIGDFLDAGNAIFAECASIENFEYRPPDAGTYNVGPFLTTNDIAHDGGTMNAATMIIEDPTIPFVQVGDVSFEPEGGHIHNWRPLTAPFTGNYDGVTSYGRPDAPVVPPDSKYVDTVKRFTRDNTGWDYFVGGYKNGDANKGFVVYLGGHSYIGCSGTPPPVPDGKYRMEMEFSANCGGAGSSYTISADYRHQGAAKNTTVTFTPADHNYAVGTQLVIDVSGIVFDGKKITNIIFHNKSVNDITLTHVEVTFNQPPLLKKFIDVTNDVELLNSKAGVASVAAFDVNDTLQAPGGAAGGNLGCTQKNTAAVRYVLNTVFDLASYVKYIEFVKSSPIVDLAKNPVTGKYEDLIVYYGSFVYPSYMGHLRALKILSNGSLSPLWDAAGGIPLSNRLIYTAVDSDADSRVNNRVTVGADSAFLQVRHNPGSRSINQILGISPYEADGITESVNYTDETSFLSGFMAQPLGGIVHSSPVVVGPSPIVDPKRAIVIYVGATDGMLHAINALDGKERWAFVPNNLLGKLYGDTLLNEADMPKASVDGSPAVADMMVDHDADGDKEPRTILVSAQGSGNHYIFALDITAPDSPLPLWEATSADMGYGYRASLGHIRVCGNYLDKNCVKAAAIVSTNSRTGTGIRVYAFDLEIGDELWEFGFNYGATSNEIPDAPVLVDKDRNGVIDSVIVGDMEGRIWELNAGTGNSVHGTVGSPKPVYEVKIAGSKGYPIGASPAVLVTDGGDVLVFFGTGGADFTPDDNAGHIFGINITHGPVAPGSANELFHYTLAKGEKCYASPIVTRNSVFFATAFGDRETRDPNQDIAGGQTGNLHIVSPAAGACWGGGTGGVPSNFDHDTTADTGKVTGGYVEGNQAVFTTMDGEVVRVGETQDDGNDLSPSERVRIDSWRDF